MYDFTTDPNQPKPELYRELAEAAQALAQATDLSLPALKRQSARLAQSVADAERCRSESGCDALMIGRGLVTDPGLALAIQGGRAVPWAEVEALLPLFWQQVRARVQPRHRAGRLKQWLNYLRHRYPEGQAAFDALRVGNDPARVEAWLASLPTVAQARPSEAVTAECA